MIPEFFRDSIPLDPKIAPMVLFFWENGIETRQSCEGGGKHLYGRPTIIFTAESMESVEKVAELLRKHSLDIGAEVGLMRGFFTQKPEYSRGYGMVQWIWKSSYPEVYDRVSSLVNLEKIKRIL